MAVAAQQPSPAASNPAWAPIVTSELSMERGRPTFGVVYISPILAAVRALKFEVDALGVITISLGCFEHCGSNKKTHP